MNKEELKAIEVCGQSDGQLSEWAIKQGITTEDVELTCQCGKSIVSGAYHVN